MFGWLLLRRQLLGLLALENPVLVGKDLGSHLLLLLTCFGKGMVTFQTLTVQNLY